LGRAYCFALRCAGIYVLSLPLSKERTKENQPGRSFRGLPCRAALHSATRDKHESCLCGAPRQIARAADMESKKSCGFLKGIRPLSPFSWFVLCRVTKNEHQNRYTERAKLGEAVGAIA
jgi:hypothetical protein